MGYDVHITRAAEWIDAATAPILLEEWVAYVASDVEMRLDGFAQATVSSGETLRTEGAGLAVWTRWPHATEQNLAWFRYENGEIVVKNPDNAILEKMMAIAKRLNAGVLGDDGESYPEEPESADPPDSPEESESADPPELPSEPATSWWKRLFR